MKPQGAGAVSRVLFSLHIGKESTFELQRFHSIILLDLFCFPSDRKIFISISRLTNGIQKFTGAWGKCSMVIARPPIVGKANISLAYKRFSGVRGRGCVVCPFPFSLIPIQPPHMVRVFTLICEQVGPWPTSEAWSLPLLMPRALHSAQKT